MAENNVRCIDHITIPPESEGTATKTYEIADSTWRKSPAKKLHMQIY